MTELNPFNFIINPLTGTRLSLFSSGGKAILQNLVKNYKSGGDMLSTEGLKTLDSIEPSKKPERYDEVYVKPNMASSDSYKAFIERTINIEDNDDNWKDVGKVDVILDLKDWKKNGDGCKKIPRLCLPEYTTNTKSGIVFSDLNTKISNLPKLKIRKMKLNNIYVKPTSDLAEKPGETPGEENLEEYNKLYSNKGREEAARNLRAKRVEEEAEASEREARLGLNEKVEAVHDFNPTDETEEYRGKEELLSIEDGEILTKVSNSVNGDDNWVIVINDRDKRGAVPNYTVQSYTPLPPSSKMEVHVPEHVRREKMKKQRERELAYERKRSRVKSKKKNYSGQIHRLGKKSDDET